MQRGLQKSASPDRHGLTSDVICGRCRDRVHAGMYFGVRIRRNGVVAAAVVDS